MDFTVAERGVSLGGELWVQESGRQTPILATDYVTASGPIAATMSARWSQENFFGYMREHYNLDRLIDYATEEVSETIRVINPQYRELDGEMRKIVNRLNRQRKEFGALCYTTR